MRTGTIDIARENHASFPKLSRRSLSGAKDCVSETESLRLYVITLRDEVSEAAHDSVVAALGGEGVISSYLPDNSYLIFANPEVVERRAKKLTRWIGDFHSGLKVNEKFYQNLLDEHQLKSINGSVAAEGDGLVWIDVHLPQNLDELRIKTCTREEPSRVLGRNLCSKAKALRNGQQPLACNISTSKVVFGLAPENVEGFVSWVVEQPEVHSIDRSKRLRLQNFHANAIMQCGQSENTDFESPSYQQEYLPAWEAGLKGQDQIVGMSDSGLGYKSCFFRDNDVDVDFERESDGVKVFYSKKHRKIDMYRCIGDCKDQNGHGTHVAGTLVGESHKSESLASKYDGVAPKARVAFTDMGTTIFNFMSTPSLSEDVFPTSYARGARVHSDSWSDSTENTAYGVFSREADDFTWKNQDFVSVFPAGNDGANNYYYTVSNPAIAKNVVAVGATLNYENKKVYVASGITLLGITGSVYFDVQKSASFNSLEAQFGGEQAYADVIGNTYDIVQANPIHACSAIVNKDEVKAKVVLIKRGGCLFTDKVRAAQEAGARAALIYNSKAKGFYYMGAPKKDPAEDVVIPSYSVSLKYGEQILNATKDGDSLRVTFQKQTAEPPTYETLAEYSSVGPTFDERIKPDIVAPGNLISAGTHTHLNRKSCFTVERSGTSMAVPVVAGAAVLIRQYFTEGRHQVFGQPKFTTPSGALIKALLLNGAKEMQGYSEAGYPMDAVPSYEQGFGRVLLKQSLPLDGSFKLFVEDAVPISSGDVHSYFIETSEDAELSVTLTWYDPPADLLSTKTLVNDLDLKVHSMPRNFDFMPNKGLGADRVNTVEQVKLRMADKGSYIVTVDAHRISRPGQKYALVASGAFVNSDARCSKTKLARIVNKPLKYRSNVKEREFLISVHDSVTQATVDAKNEDILCKFSDCGKPNAGSSTNGYHDWKSCGSQAKYTNLSDGYHCFQVEYNDSIHYSEFTAPDDYYRFYLDTVAPVSQIDFQPDALTGKRNAYLSFSSSDGDSVVTFDCRLERDGGVAVHDWAECESPVNYLDLEDASYKFTVRARDDLGNSEPSGAEAAWTVDTLGPRTTITSAPEMANSSAITFAFTSPEESGTSFGGYMCAHLAFDPNLSSRDQRFETQWGACTSPHTITGLVDGICTFGVKSYDSLGNFDESPEYSDFEVDTVAPSTALVFAPATQTNTESLVFHFASSEEGVSHQCLFGLLADLSENTPWDTCRSPSIYMDQPEGLYRFRVRAQDQAGNVGSFVEGKLALISPHPSLSAHPYPFH